MLGPGSWMGPWKGNWGYVWMITLCMENCISEFLLMSEGCSKVNKPENAKTNLLPGS